jgi:hypothetical protein
LTPALDDTLWEEELLWLENFENGVVFAPDWVQGGPD